MTTRPLGTNLAIFVGVVPALPRFSKLNGSGAVVCNFEVETAEQVRDGLRVERHPIAAFGDVADVMRQAIPGCRVLVRGGLRTRSWNRAGGGSSRVYETIAYYLELLPPVVAAASSAGDLPA